MKKLLAFTLAEVLITLAIIGVVATLTLPTLMTDVNKRRAGAALAKAVNSLVNNNKMLLEDTDAFSLQDICGNGNYIDCLGKATPLSYDSSSGLYITKDGIGYKNYSWGWQHSYSAPSKFYGGTYVPVIVDVNGKKIPNKMGVDQFLFWVDSRGLAIPYGGSEYVLYTKGVVGGYDAPWRSYCNENYVSRPEYCAGAAADNNYMVNFNYN